MASKAVYFTVAAGGIVLASAVGWWIQSRPQLPREVGRAIPATPGPTAAPRPVGVEVAKVEVQPLRDEAQAVGTLRSRQNVVLRPEVAGRVAGLGFMDGAWVKRGQMLVQLDDALQKAELSQAQAQLSVAQANHKRNQELVARNFVAQRVLDESAAALQVAQAQLDLASARLARMRVVAPFDGVVGIRQVNLGDYVKDGADLVALEDLSAMFVDFSLPERFQPRLRTGQPVELELDALPGSRYTARIVAVNPLVDATGRAVAVRASLPNSAGDKPGRPARASASGAAAKGEAGPLRAGMFARVTAVFAVRDSALVVPEEALLPQGGKQYVVKVVAASALPGHSPAVPGADVDAGMVSLRQEVRLGLRRQGKVEITEGVAEGDTVVVAGQQRLQRDGTPVRIVVAGRGDGAVPAKSAASTPVPR